jgi:hypothetical protein
MSLLTVVQDVCDIIGIERPVAVAAGTGGDARQLFRLAKLELSQLARRTSWQALTKQTTFNALAQESQTAALATDFLFIVNETMFNRTQDREVYGPIPPREWQLALANTAHVTLLDTFRIRGNAILLYPTPTLNDVYAYEYVTNKLATASDLTTEKLTYLVDADVAKLDEELVKLGVVWRWKNIKGLDYAEDFRVYEMEVANSISRDGGKRTVSMAGDRPTGAPMVGIPDGNWTP